ncbi:uncharacterized protein I303_100296 [Kwoniella dejecticola CBS 10117]|uniref:Protein phosphatase n=1 Tax=Kwoniella dejecticola CBS 10117 TaxID=1296121 RepID=A0A1A6AEK5_9TREE|nr:uncharacterized protein I303_00296 [Kwoniella dejecticola CBS 10117]OBR88479.1 hypothetical protein I303_00296 [Kwoniella dejecticola CBS 10117]
MSKPKPGLGKGLVRTFATSVSQFPSHSHSHHHQGIITLAPVIGQHHYHSSASSASSPSSSTLHNAIPTGKNSVNGWPTSTSSSSSSTITLLPTWDQPNEIVLPYHPSSLNSYSSSSSSSRIRLKSNAAPVSGATIGIGSGQVGPASRRYSSISISPSAFLTSPIPPPTHSLFFDKSLSYQIHQPTATPPSPAQISLEALLNALEPTTPNSDFGFHPRNHSCNDIPPPPPPDPPSSPSPLPSASRSSSPNNQPIKGLRSVESHTVLSPNPLSPDTDSTSNQSTLFSSNSLLSLNDTANYGSAQALQEDSEDIVPSTYSSSLIFHLGCSGLPKERIALPPSKNIRRTPQPPRARNFPLPEVESPSASSLKSVGVGEDAYFARSDGLCIADGVGGWSRSASASKGSADAGRWSRLLTHFVEEEVADWWSGKEYYLVSTGESTAQAKGEDQRQGQSQKKGEEVNEEVDQPRKQAKTKAHGWARETWENRLNRNMSSSASVSSSPSSSSSPAAFAPATATPMTGEKTDGQRERRPIDPVEIMQRGFEKCLSCINAEGTHGSSTCLLALLHNSTLHIANLGDCCLLLIRKGEVVFRTQEMQHAFNFPLQVGTHSRDEPMKDAQRYDVGVKKGDVVILGSDGLMDNLFDEEILEIVLQFTSSSSSSSDSTSDQAQLPTPPSTPPSEVESRASISLPFSPQQVSEALCKKARSISELVTATTPFMCKAIEEGIDFVGGKKDDISVLVGVIGDKEEVSQDGAGQAQEGRSTMKGGLQLHL